MPTRFTLNPGYRGWILLVFINDGAHVLAFQRRRAHVMAERYSSEYGRVLAELDEPKREIFVMVEVLEMTVPEVVQALAIPLNTAYSRLRLARKLFEEALAKHEAADGENR